MNRNDISIVITADRRVWLAQGKPALASIEGDVVAAEHGLYYSQLPHRAARMRADGVMDICYPRDVTESDHAIVGFRGYSRCTGSACLIGTI